MRIVEILLNRKYLIVPPESWTGEDAQELQRQMEAWLTSSEPVAILMPGLKLVRVNTDG